MVIDPEGWAFVVSRLEGDVTRYVLTRHGAPVTFRMFAEACREDASFRAFFNATLGNAPFDAFFFEAPVVAAATIDRPFEFILADSPALSRTRACPDDFVEHFQADEKVAAFASLGGDASLIVPCPRGPRGDYAHLAAFVRRAPEDQHDALWKTVGKELSSIAARRAVWFNTSGLGVPWLHVRLDSRPKYYTYAPYRSG